VDRRFRSILRPEEGSATITRPLGVGVVRGVEYVADKKRSSRILVVDDELVVREVVRNVLDKPGLYLVDAADGEQAISLLLKEPFDLLIADKNLPGITGLDVIRCAKAVDANIGVLLITAYASRESAEEAMAIGVDDYIVKPFELSDLEQKVDEVIELRWKRVSMTRTPEKSASRQVVLICDPNRDSQECLVDGVKLLGHKPRVVAKVAEVLEALRKKDVDSLICDLDLIRKDNAASCFLRSTLLVTPDIQFVAVARERGLEGAVEAIHHGAGHVIYRPLKNGMAVAENLKAFLGKPE
jgi:DNA-binding NtrC family response regulator